MLCHDLPTYLLIYRPDVYSFVINININGGFNSRWSQTRPWVRYVQIGSVHVGWLCAILQVQLRLTLRAAYLLFLPIHNTTKQRFDIYSFMYSLQSFNLVTTYMGSLCGKQGVWLKLLKYEVLETFSTMCIIVFVQQGMVVDGVSVGITGGWGVRPPVNIFSPPSYCY